MDRIAEIKKHLQAADGDERTVSKHRWMAAELIWQEIRDGKSRRALGQEIGKSHTHVRYMYNCWESVGRKLEVSGGLDSFPNFQTIYMSAEVRGDYDPESGDGEKEGSPRDRKKGKGKDQRDFTASGLVATAANALRSLASNEAYWSLLTEEDLTVLRAIPPTVRGILRESGR